MRASSRHLPAVLLFLSLALLVAAPARAQYQRLGFVSAGVGGAPQEAYLDAQFTIAAGFIARFGPPVGVSVGVRSITAYSRLRPDESALLDSLGAASGEVEGGSATVSEVGLDLMAGYDTGALGGYGWYGIHYYNESRSDAVITTPGGTFQSDVRNRADLGPSYGAGVQWRIVPRAAVFAEWFRGGGFDDRMIRLEGLRLGVNGVF
ncbi:hypothetical protein [Longimicrobium sp.]|uniref:hypothetical protein n=1 Tax=Longimicrobium sp. TaxID=2029185 RepID=UPI002C447A6A|nr:hypothetical protein [Longimicrobium sp.]HSU17613.1 hypothetical protein [Longimicrobium sp.]